MAKYAVSIHASNFLVDMGGAVAKHGFYVSRVVDAADPAAAELIAIQMLRDDQDLRKIVRNATDDRPVIDVQEIREVDHLPDKQPGKVWYRMETKRWWEFWKRTGTTQ